MFKLQILYFAIAALIAGIFVGYQYKQNNTGNSSIYTVASERWPEKLEELLQLWNNNDTKAFPTAVKLAQEAAVYWHPYMCLFEDGPKKSLYVSYGEPAYTMTQTTNIELIQDAGVVWKYRTAVYQVQLATLRTLNEFCPELRDLVHPVKQITSFDDTVICFNPTTIEATDLQALFAQNGTKDCLAKMKDEEFSRAQRVVNASLAHISNYNLQTLRQAVDRNSQPRYIVKY